MHVEEEKEKEYTLEEVPAPGNLKKIASTLTLVGPKLNMLAKEDSDYFEEALQEEYIQDQIS